MTSTITSFVDLNNSALFRKVDNPVYKPFSFPWAYDLWNRQQQMHWMPDEVPMADDVLDYQGLSEANQYLLTQIFRFFVQADVEVNNCYQKKYAGIFQPVEVNMMLTAFSNMECFDKETELLTSKGWKKCRKITKDDLVAQYDLKTQEITFVNPLKVVKYPYKGIMHHYQGRHTDICVTPNHDLILRLRGNSTKAKSMDRPNLGTDRNYMYPVAGYATGSDDTVTTLDRLLIAIQADGNVRGLSPSRLARGVSGSIRDRHISLKLGKTRKIERLKGFLNGLGIPFTETPVLRTEDTPEHWLDSVVIGFSLEPAVFKNLKRIKNLRFLRLKGMSSERASDLLDEILFWDGSTEGVSSYYNTNKAAVDKFQALAVLCGKNAHIGINSAAGTEHNDLGNGPVTSTKNCYVVSLSERPFKNYQPKTEIEYDDFVYCVSVPTQNLVSRRNNRVAITGNTVHIAAYSHLLDTLGLPEVEYAAFLQYKEMKDKADYMHSFNVGDPEGLLHTMAVFGAFVEGLSLFASFAILLNFTRHAKMRGMGQIIAMSLKDESLHVEGILRLFHTILDENPSLWTPELRDKIVASCKQVVEYEDAFIDLSFKMGPLENLTGDDVKKYCRFIADRRLLLLKMEPIYKVKKNPLPWIDKLIAGSSMSNFFETAEVNYSKGALGGSWGDAFTAEHKA